MIRTGLVFTAGVLAGAAAVFVFVNRLPSLERPAVGSSVGAASPAMTERARSAGAAAGLDVDERLDIYRVAAEADLATLEQRIAAVASEPDSARRRFTLEVLLLRLAELDTARALRATRGLELGPDVLAALYARAAEADFELALDGLVTIAGIEAAHAAGLAVLAARDYDASALEAVVAALPGADARAFRVEALAALARVDPDAALEQARAMYDGALRDRALNELARVWARSAPETALARAGELGGNVAERFRAAVYAAWVAEDAVAALRHAARNDARPMSLASLFGPASSGFGDADPHALLAVADELRDPTCGS